MTEKESLNSLTGTIIECAIRVHKELGPGLLESVYEECLCHEIGLAGLSYERQKQLPIKYRGKILEGCAFRVDILVEKKVVVEVKAVEAIVPIYKAQLLTYLKLSKLKVGLLINFNVPVLKSGIRRLVNNL